MAWAQNKRRGERESEREREKNLAPHTHSHSPLTRHKARLNSSLPLSPFYSFFPPSKKKYSPNPHPPKHYPSLYYTDSPVSVSYSPHSTLSRNKKTKTKTKTKKTTKKPHIIFLTKHMFSSRPCFAVSSYFPHPPPHPTPGLRNAQTTTNIPCFPVPLPHSPQYSPSPTDPFLTLTRWPYPCLRLGCCCCCVGELLACRDFSPR